KRFSNKFVLVLISCLLLLCFLAVFLLFQMKTESPDILLSSLPSSIEVKYKNEEELKKALEQYQVIDNTNVYDIKTEITTNPISEPVVEQRDEQGQILSTVGLTRQGEEYLST